VNRRTHVLVDLDGTITDSLPAITGSLKLALADVGLAVPADDVLRSVVGPPFEVGLPAIGVPADSMAAVIERYRLHYEGGGLFECTLYDGVVEMLDQLRVSGHRLAMATAKPEPTAVRIIEHFGLADRFAVLAGATYEPGRRTKGDVIAHALRQLEAGAGPDVVLVGDRDHDVEGARDHGIDCIGALWGYGGEAELVAAGAWALAATPADVLALVASPSECLPPSECFVPGNPRRGTRMARNTRMDLA
jgi:phosphoglycolate phosphatase